MDNWFAIETEAESIRLERERTAAAEAHAAQATSRAAQATCAGQPTRWPHIPHLSLAPLRSLTMPHVNGAMSSCTPRPV
jgi:hypothetical protein